MQELRCQTCGGLLASAVDCQFGGWTIKCLKCQCWWRFKVNQGVLTTTGQVSQRDLPQPHGPENSHGTG